MKEEKKYIKFKLSTSVVIIVFIMILSVISIYFLTESIEKDKIEIESNQQKVQESVNKNTIVNDEIEVKENNTEKQEIEKKSNKTKGDNINQDISNNTSSVNDKYDEITQKIDLNEKEIFVVTDVEKNEGKYTLKGRVYTDYTLTKSEYDDAKETGKITINGVKYTVNKDEDGEGLTLFAKKDYLEYHISKDNNGKYVLMSGTQQGNCYKATEIYKKIVVDGNTKCVHINYNGSIDKEEVLKDTTVKDYFKDFKNITEDNTEPGELLPNYNFEFKNGKCTKVTIRTIYI